MNAAICLLGVAQIRDVVLSTNRLIAPDDALNDYIQGSNCQPHLPC